MKCFFLTTCIFLSVAINAQKHKFSINCKPSLTFLGKQNQPFDHYYFSERNGNMTFNNSFASLYSYKLSSKLVLTTGAEMSQQGQNINFKTNSAVPKADNIIFCTQLHYIRIPLLIAYSIYKENKSELFLQTGLSLGIVTKRKDNYQEIILENILLPPSESRYKDKDWAIPVGVNYQRDFANNVYTILGIEYLFGLTNSFSENGFSKFGVLSEFENSKQRRLAINIGIGFNLTR